MAFWRRLNASSDPQIEAAAAGIPFMDFMGGMDDPTPTSTVATPQPDILLSLNDKLTCGHFTQINGKMHFTRDVASSCQFWTEGVASVGVAAFGLMGNLISIWVLSVPEMRCTAFNRLLLALAFIDCMFIGPAVLIYVFETFKIEANWYNYLFPLVFYPCSEIALCSSIYMTVAIAVERFIGLCRPFRRLSSRPCPAKAYILPVLAISILLNIPKFLEAETVVTVEYGNPDDVIGNVTRTRVGVTALRTHPHYITYYTMWTRLLATGIFPLAMLAILNTKIYLALRKSKAQLRSMAIRAALPMAILGKPATPPSQMADLRIDSNWPNANGNHSGVSNGGSATPPLGGHASRSPKPHPMNRSVSAAVVESTRLREPLTRSHSTAAATPSMVTSQHNPAPPTNDLNLAPVLFGVVIVFILCNTLRVFLNVFDFSQIEAIIDCEKKGVGRMPPAWVMCSVSVSHLLLMINSSVNFLVYCVAGSKFRSILYQHLASTFKHWRLKKTPGGGGHAPIRGRNNEVALLPPPPAVNGRRLLQHKQRFQHPRIVELNEADV